MLNSLKDFLKTISDHDWNSEEAVLIRHLGKFVIGQEKLQEGWVNVVLGEPDLFMLISANIVKDDDGNFRAVMLRGVHYIFDMQNKRVFGWHSLNDTVFALSLNRIIPIFKKKGINFLKVAIDIFDNDEKIEEYIEKLGKDRKIEYFLATERDVYKFFINLKHRIAEIDLGVEDGFREALRSAIYRFNVTRFVVREDEKKEVYEFLGKALIELF